MSAVLCAAEVRGKNRAQLVKALAEAVHIPPDAQASSSGYDNTGATITFRWIEERP